MVNDVAKINGKKIRMWLKKRSDAQLTKAVSKRERYISILQNRYGYTKEVAAVELDKHYPKAILC
jgi:hypothetical protein